MMERAISFLNPEGIRLVGIYHEPDEHARNVGILFVHGGSQGRLGHTNQYVYYAREFTRHGFPCLRFDPTGLGDSEGLVEEVDRRDFFGSIQTGRYVADVCTALDEFRRSGVDKVVLFGLCGGAISALLTGSYQQSVCGMILISCPVVIDGANIDQSLMITTPLARKDTFLYMKKLLRISALWRFLTFKTDYQRLFNSLKAAVRLQADTDEDSHGEDDTGIKGPRPNKYFFQAYGSCGNKNILWVYGSNDGFWFLFQRAALNKLNIGTRDELYLVQNGNHMFTLPEWQHEICAVTLDWLSRQGY